MVPKVTLTVQGGSQDGQEYTFAGPTQCVIGRADDCAVRLHHSWESLMVSRRHCELDVDPPHVRVRDLGSRNGTYLNGRLIGRRCRDELPEDVTQLDSCGHELADGDELGVGPITLRVRMTGVEAAAKGRTKEKPTCGELADKGPKQKAAKEPLQAV
jgi:pSer/pThr/pTyr-binding forkhead associated (FHA) protein